MKIGKSEDYVIMRPAKQISGLTKMIQWINEKRPTSEMVLVEIGSYTGESSALFAKHFKTVICVDPWMGGYDDNDPASKSNMNIVENEFDKRMSTFSNVLKRKETSEEAQKSFSEGEIDIVYIDGNHTFQAVLKDISLWKNVVKGDGFVAGHDHYSKNVRNAVKESFGISPKTFPDTSWIIKR